MARISFKISIEAVIWRTGLDLHVLILLPDDQFHLGVCGRFSRVGVLLEIMRPNSIKRDNDIASSEARFSYQLVFFVDDDAVSRWSGENLKTYPFQAIWEKIFHATLKLPIITGIVRFCFIANNERHQILGIIIALLNLEKVFPRIRILAQRF